jgi:alkylation response protein AidB-like acyl-CoA dehydrogenase
VRRFAREQWPVSESRRLADDPRGYDPKVWRTMTRELGLAGLLVPESAGGQGFSMLELGIALEELGAELAGGPLFASACLGAATLLAVAGEGERKELLPDLAAGEAIVALAHRDGVRAVDGRLDGTQRLVLDAQNATLLLVRADDDAGVGVYAVEPTRRGWRSSLRPRSTSRAASPTFAARESPRVASAAAMRAPRSRASRCSAASRSRPSRWAARAPASIARSGT